jgi:stage III sporulation protein AG
MENVSAKVQEVMRSKKMLWIVGGLGVLLLFNPLAWFGSGKEPTVPKAAETVVTNDSRPTMETYEKAYEDRLVQILDTVRGVSDATVMVTIDSSEEVVYARDTQENKQTTNETDLKGGTRGVTQFDDSGHLVILKKNGSEQPIVVKTVKPRVRGVVVTARGAEDVRVQALITEAVQRALEVPPHKISILPKKS